MKTTLDFQQIKQLREMLGDEELSRIVGINFTFHTCIGENCVREGDHKDHTWWEESFQGDELEIERNKENKKYNIPLRYWNFLVALSQTKNLQKAVQWVKDEAMIGDEPMNLATKLGAKNYGQLFKKLQITP
jgi:hypothetical protein